MVHAIKSTMDVQLHDTHRDVPFLRFVQGEPQTFRDLHNLTPGAKPKLAGVEGFTVLAQQGGADTQEELLEHTRQANRAPSREGHRTVDFGDESDENVTPRSDAVTVPGVPVNAGFEQRSKGRDGGVRQRTNQAPSESVGSGGGSLLGFRLRDALV